MKIFTNAGETSIMFVVIALCGFSLQRGRAAVQEVSTDGNAASDISPFLLLGVGSRLYSLPYTWPDAPRDTQKILLHESGSQLHYITGISYHYRKRLIFWCTSGGVVYQGSFQDRTKLTDISTRQVITGGSFFDFRVVGDLAVDWINDKLYWTDRDEGIIEELDLETDERKVILESKVPAAFNGLAMYPYPDYGWLYWTDNQAGMIERVAVTGERRQLIQGGIRSCIWPVEIDYSEQNVYWANTCQNSLKSLNIGDSDQPVNRVQINSAFRDTYSMTIFEDTLYWNEGRMVKATNKSLDLGEVVTIFEPDETSLVFSIAVEVVHAKKQPEAKEFLDLISDRIGQDLLNETCPPCVNGKCLPPGGNCTCFTGWTGDNCTTDIDECALGGSGCEQICVNTPGSFHCSCDSGFYLDSNGSSCIPVPTTYVIEPSVSSLGIGPEETPTGDHESTSLTSTSPIHSTTIVSAGILLPVTMVFSSEFMTVLLSSTSDKTISTELIFLPEPSSSTLYIVSSSYMTLYSSSSAVSIISESSSSVPGLSSRELLNLLRTSAYLGHTVSENNNMLLVSTHMYGSSSSAGHTQVTENRLQTSTVTAAMSSSELIRLHGRTSTYTDSEQATISSPPTSTSALLSTTPGSVISTAVVISVATSFQAVATPSPTSSSFTVISSSPMAYTTLSSSPVLTSSHYATRAPLTPSQMIVKPQETSTAESRTTMSDSSTDSLPSGIEPSSDNMTLIIIVAAAGGSCAILVIVVVIMIVAVVHYVHNRCGSYTVNPDPSKESGGTPSWITVSSGSPLNHHTSNGHSHLVKSTFKAQSPTCSTNSFT